MYVGPVCIYTLCTVYGHLAYRVHTPDLPTLCVVCNNLSYPFVDAPTNLLIDPEPLRGIMKERAWRRMRQGFFKEIVENPLSPGALQDALKSDGEHGEQSEKKEEQEDGDQANGRPGDTTEKAVGRHGQADVELDEEPLDIRVSMEVSGSCFRSWPCVHVPCRLDFSLVQNSLSIKIFRAGASAVRSRAGFARTRVVGKSDVRGEVPAGQCFRYSATPGYPSALDWGLADIKSDQGLFFCLLLACPYMPQTDLAELDRYYEGLGPWPSTEELRRYNATYCRLPGLLRNVVSVSLLRGFWCLLDRASTPTGFSKGSPVAT